MDNLLIPKNSKIVSEITELIKNHSLVLKINQMFLSKEEKERRIIDLYYYNQGKTFRDIAKELRMSLNAKTAIIKKKGIIVSLLLIRNNLLLLLPKHMNCFSKDKRPVEVAITLNLKEPEVKDGALHFRRKERLNSHITMIAVRDENTATTESEHLCILWSWYYPHY